jgi:hypothetical protein
MHSWWYFIIGLYFAILSVVRFVIFLSKSKGNFIIRFTGVMLMTLSLPLVGTVVLAFMKERGTVFHEIIMITIAVYAFTKITLATMNLIKTRRSKSVKHVALRNISFADALVSIFSMQRSMLVTFEGMSGTEIKIFNVALGAAVSILVFLLGFHLIYNISKRYAIK